MYSRKRGHAEAFSSRVVERLYKRPKSEASAIEKATSTAVGTGRMGRSRTFTRTSRKRKGGRRRRLLRRRVARGIPFTKVVELKTSFLGQHNPAAGTIGVDTIALNGGNDPTLAVGSGQPLYWDQWCTMYRRYCVIGWKIDFQVVTTDNTNPTVFGFCPLTTSTPLASHLAYKEVAGNKSVVCTPDIDKNYMSAKGSVEKYLLGNKVRGRMLSDDNLYALTSTNPTNVLYGHIYTQAFDQSADPAVINYCATLRQIVVFFDPIVPGRS